MTVESIDLEEGALTLDLEDTHSPTSSWNGRSVQQTQSNKQMEEVRSMTFHSVDTRAECSLDGEQSFDSDEPTTVLCGGSVSVRGHADTEGNQGAEVEVEVENEEGSFSASASGGVSQDRDGNTKGEVEVEVTISF